MSLFRAEESVEEQGIRESFRISVIDPSDIGGLTGAENQPTVRVSPVLASPPHPEPNPPASASFFKVPSPLPTSRVSSPRVSSQDIRFSESDDTARPVLGRVIPPSSTSGDLSPSEPQLGVASEVINPVEEEDEEMPSIDMGSDSD